MTMLPQPPPDAEAPPPSEAALRSHRWWRWIWIPGTISIVVLLLSPFAFRSGKSPDKTKAYSNLRLTGLALFEFEQEYGRFPDFTTIADVRRHTGTTLSLGTKSSNDFFRQLLATEMTQSESQFYARISGTRRPDENIAGAEALKKSECGFTYLLGATGRSNPQRPLAVTPMIPGTDRFDPKPFDGTALILRKDRSVISLTIDKRGHVFIDGRNLMDPHHPIWERNPPAIAWPEL